MEEWRVHRLFEVNDENGKKLPTGGGMVRMRIGAVNGSLHTIDVSPVSAEDMKEEGWEDSFVRLQVADRVIWMDITEVQTLIDLLVLAHGASLRNHDIANS